MTCLVSLGKVEWSRFAWFVFEYDEGFVSSGVRLVSQTWYCTHGTSTVGMKNFRNALLYVRFIRYNSKVPNAPFQNGAPFPHELKNPEFRRGLGQRACCNILLIPFELCKYCCTKIVQIICNTQHKLNTVILCGVYTEQLFRSPRQIVQKSIKTIKTD